MLHVDAAAASRLLDRLIAKPMENDNALPFSYLTSIASSLTDWQPGCTLPIVVAERRRSFRNATTDNALDSHERSSRRTLMKSWHKPEVTEQEVGLEVTTYLPAELDQD